MREIKGCWYKRLRDGEEFMITEIYKESGRYCVAFSHANYTGSLGMSLSDFERLLNKG